jgi:hypothetical protein
MFHSLDYLTWMEGRVLLIRHLGTYKMRPGRSECYDSDSRRPAGHGDVARYLVLGIQSEQTSTENCGYDSGRKVLIVMSWCNLSSKMSRVQASSA